jgi:hypothetical protein
MGKFRINIGCIVFAITVILVFQEAHSTDVYSIESVDDGRYNYNVYKNSSLYWSVNLENLLVDDEGLTSYYSGEYVPPLSPDSIYYSFILSKDSSEKILLLKVTDKTHLRFEMPEEYYTEEGPLDVKWISNDVLLTRFSRFTSIRYNINNSTSMEIGGGSTLNYDANGINYCMVVGADIHDDIIIDGMVLDIEDYKPNVLRYNGYWIYPIPLNGYVTYEQECDFEKGNESTYSDLLIPDYGLTNHYALSRPVFLDNTTWVGFIEQIYTNDDPSQILETNIVAVDAHNVSNRPPLQGNINVLKLNINPIPNSYIDGYFAFPISVDSSWNETTNSIEIWKYDHTYQTRIQKIGEVPISFNPFQFGTYVSYIE